MTSTSFGKQMLVIFLVSLLGYAVAFYWIEQRRHTNGPWEVTFTTESATAAIVVNQPTLQITNVTICFRGIPGPTNVPQTVTFAHGRAAPFPLPFGTCVFIDTIFLPGTATCEIFGHEIQLLPRTLTLDRVEHPWRSGEKFFLTNTGSATLRTH